VGIKALDQARTGICAGRCLTGALDASTVLFRLQETSPRRAYAGATRAEVVSEGTGPAFWRYAITAAVSIRRTLCSRDRWVSWVCGNAPPSWAAV
jgi:hypothetical protein